MRLLSFLVVCLVTPSLAAPRGCTGSTPVGTFRFTVQPEKGGEPRSVRLVNAIRAGQKLSYEPVHLPSTIRDKAAIAVVLMPTQGDLEVLETHPAKTAAQWTVPHDVSVVALIFGPQGLSVGKLKSLVGKNQEMLTQLADYAEQNSQMEALVETLADSEQSGKSLDAALTGFSTQYGVALPKLDTHASTDQQASLLLKALMPSVSSYDPLTSPRNALVQQGTGLAASMAALFLGSPVGLAAGGASLFQNLRTVMFPNTEFRSAFAQLSSDGLALCAKTQQAKSRTRPAYLWAHRVPNLPAPRASVPGSPHLPMGIKSVLKLDTANLKSLDRAHDWRLVSAAGSAPANVAITADGLALDLTKTIAKPGEYHLAAQWDWDTFQLDGTLELKPLADMKAVALTRASRDRLVEGSGRVAVELTGADFEFVQSVALDSTELPFTKQGGLRAEIDTARRGHYRLFLTQAGGRTSEVPIDILPPNPKLENLPLRANLGERSQLLALKGTGLERIESLATDAADIRLEKGAADITLHPDVKKGDVLAVRMKVQGISEPLTIPDAIRVAGPRPKLLTVRTSFPAESANLLKPGEIPAGSTTSFALTVQDIDGPPSVELSCGEKHNTFAPSIAGEGLLFLSLDPATLGNTGCRLTAAVTTAAAGASDPYDLGHVVRVPRIEQFQLTDEKLGEAVYSGILRGENLELIEKTGWDAEHGLPVPGIPAPVAGEARKQTLRVAMPWPSPSPHAPIFIWLRGESSGRPSGVKY